MRRGLVALSVALIVLAGIGLAAGAYHAGENHGIAQQIDTTAGSTEVVRVVGDGYGWGHGGFFPFGFFVFPLFIIGTILLVRALLWRRGHWGGPGGGWGHHGPGGPGGPREDWMTRAEAWHRSQHAEAGDHPTSDAGGGGAPEPAA
jgi:hypothetical protein